MARPLVLVLVLGVFGWRWTTQDRVCDWDFTGLLGSGTNPEGVVDLGGALLKWSRISGSVDVETRVRLSLQWSRGARGGTRHARGVLLRWVANF